VARVRFEPSGVELSVGAGERVLDAADDHPEVGLPLACRGGNCGACLVHVRAGGARLVAAAAHERETLAALGAGPDQRLGCLVAVDSPAIETGSPIVLAVVAARPRDERKS
jgi:ferredoxin